MPLCGSDPDIGWDEGRCIQLLLDDAIGVSVGVKKLQNIENRKMKKKKYKDFFA